MSKKVKWYLYMNPLYLKSYFIAFSGINPVHKMVKWIEFDFLFIPE